MSQMRGRLFLFHATALVLATSCELDTMSGQNLVTVSSETRVSPGGLDNRAGAGNAVAIDGDTIAVSTFLYDILPPPMSSPWNDGRDAGAVHVYTYNGVGWDLQDEIMPSDGYTGDNFGNSLALQGDHLVIGAFNADTPEPSSGAAYVFTRTSTLWSQQARFPDAASGLNLDLEYEDQFGYAVAIDASTVAVTAPRDDDAAEDAGAVYVFARDATGWELQAKILSPSSSGNTYFGQSVALDGDILIVGTPGESGGAVYVFGRDAGVWSHVARLQPGDIQEGDLFGTSLSLDGSTLLIGAKADDLDTSEARDQGSAYIFAKDSSGAWSEQSKLTAMDSAAGDTLGTSVVLQGDLALVSAVGDQDRGFLSGSIYVYLRNGAIWSDAGKLTASNGASGDLFGYSIAIDDDHVVAGAVGKNSGDGAAYVMTLALPTNLPPTSDAGPDQIPPCIQPGTTASVTLDGSDSSDPNGDALTYRWFQNGLQIASGVTPTLSLGTGVHTITLIVNDGQADSAPTDVRVVIEECVATCSTSETSVWDACSSDCPCPDETGDCDSDADCAPGLRCYHDIGDYYGYGDSEIDICLASCPAVPVGGWDFCTSECPCDDGEGDCDSDSECAPGMQCIRNVGLSYGYTDPDIDVCVAGCPLGGIGTWDYCSPECPCGAGEGDCDSNSDCETGLTCVTNVGSNYGWDSDVDVCELQSP